jgi:hypothetical protein
VGGDGGFGWGGYGEGGDGGAGLGGYGDGGEGGAGLGGRGDGGEGLGGYGEGGGGGEGGEGGLLLNLARRSSFRFSSLSSLGRPPAEERCANSVAAATTVARLMQLHLSACAGVGQRTDGVRDLHNQIGLLDVCGRRAEGTWPSLSERPAACHGRDTYAAVATPSICVPPPVTHRWA